MDSLDDTVKTVTLEQDEEFAAEEIPPQPHDGYHYAARSPISSSSYSSYHNSNFNSPQRSLFCGCCCCDMQTAAYIINIFHIMFAAYCIIYWIPVPAIDNDTTTRTEHNLIKIWIGICSTTLLLIPLTLFGVCTVREKFVIWGAMWYCLLATMSLIAYGLIFVILFALSAYPHLVLIREFQQGLYGRPRLLLLTSWQQQRPTTTMNNNNNNTSSSESAAVATAVTTTATTTISNSINTNNNNDGTQAATTSQNNVTEQGNNVASSDNNYRRQQQQQQPSSSSSTTTTPSTMSTRIDVEMTPQPTLNTATNTSSEPTGTSTENGAAGTTTTTISSEQSHAETPTTTNNDTINS